MRKTLNQLISGSLYKIKYSSAFSSKGKDFPIVCMYIKFSFNEKSNVYVGEFLYQNDIVECYFSTLSGAAICAIVESV